jgi:hypothetical protein
MSAINKIEKMNVVKNRKLLTLSSLKDLSVLQKPDAGYIRRMDKITRQGNSDRK